MNGNYQIYIIQCENGHYYTGIAADLLKRFMVHLKGGVKYTRSFPPLGICQCWRVPGGRGPALRVEAYIKNLPRSGKEELVRDPRSLAGRVAGLVPEAEGIEPETGEYLRSIESAARESVKSGQK